MFKESKKLYQSGQTPEVRLERKGNVVRIDKPEGTYTILYGDHKKPQDPEQLPEAIDGIVLERNGALDRKPSELSLY